MKKERITIKDKCDTDSVEEIIALGYPENDSYVIEMLQWTCDPNWPVAGPIYAWFRELGHKEAQNVINTSVGGDMDWRFTLLTQIISSYDRKTLKDICLGWLKIWAGQAGSEMSDIEALRIIAENELLEPVEISKIARRNLFVYNLYIKETMEVAEKSIYKFPLSEHTV